MALSKFSGNVAAMAGLWGVKREVLDGYVALATAGGSVDDLTAYALRNNLNIDRASAERTVASVAHAKP